MSSRTNAKRLLNAIEKWKPKQVQSLIDSGSVDANTILPTPERPPALVHAARRGQSKTVELLLNAGARIDDSDLLGNTACHVAVERLDDEMVALLLEHGPNLGLENVEELHPLLSLACKRGYAEDEARQREDALRDQFFYQDEDEDEESDCSYDIDRGALIANRLILAGAPLCADTVSSLADRLFVIRTILARGFDFRSLNAHEMGLLLQRALQR